MQNDHYRITTKKEGFVPRLFPVPPLRSSRDSVLSLTTNRIKRAVYHYEYVNIIKNFSRRFINSYKINFEFILGMDYYAQYTQIEEIISNINFKECE